jgi:hypothetical protein
MTNVLGRIGASFLSPAYTQAPSAFSARDPTSIKGNFGLEARCSDAESLEHLVSLSVVAIERYDPQSPLPLTGHTTVSLGMRSYEGTFCQIHGFAV